MSTPHPMTLDRERSALVVIDVQERLFPAMDADHREEVMRNIKVLTAVARRLHLGTLVTEQYPKGLGHTLQEVKDTLPPGVQPVEKVAFSCWGVEAVRSRLTATGARQILLAGIEAHVCVLMSALDLLAEGYAVHVVADAVTSRTQGNWRLAMAQLRQAGAVVTTTETALFQLLRQADTDDFRELARLIR
ncbi:MAG TPA: hydrolase [Candidatus Deferrimicrobiaceae bacterium]|nr:hydrolase [Candidatus Deferrimicrobiaceae bacterium]